MADQDLLGGDVTAPLGRVAVRDGLPERRDAVVGGVPGRTGRGRLEGALEDVGRRAEAGLADLQMEDVRHRVGNLHDLADA